MTDMEPVQPTDAPASDKKGKKEKEKKPLWREIVEWVVTLAVAVGVAMLVRTFVFEPVKVDGHSMESTLHDREVMFVTKWEYVTGDPERFDVVICHYPNRGQLDFVKRVVGLPGDTVEIKDGYLYVNDVRYEEEYLTHRPDYVMPKHTVAEGHYFVLGDNRSNSNDSHLIGDISRDMIVGHVRQVIFPFDAWRTIE